MDLQDHRLTKPLTEAEIAQQRRDYKRQQKQLITELLLDGQHTYEQIANIAQCHPMTVYRHNKALQHQNHDLPEDASRKH